MNPDPVIEELYSDTIGELGIETGGTGNRLNPKDIVLSAIPEAFVSTEPADKCPFAGGRDLASVQEFWLCWDITTV